MPPAASSPTGWAHTMLAAAQRFRGGSILPIGDDRLEARIEDGAVLEGDPGHALVGQQPAPAAVLAPPAHAPEQVRFGLAVHQQHRRHPRPGCPPGLQVGVHGQRTRTLRTKGVLGLT
jgi:hypothetical protein